MSYPPQQGGYPPQGQPGQPGYPPQQGGYPPQGQPGQPGQPGYPPQQGGFPPQQGGYPPQGQPGQPGQPGYPPQQGGYPPQQGGYPPQQGGYPPQQGGYPPQGQPGQPWYNQYNTGVDAQKMQTLRAWFDSVDKDRSGQINAAELAQVQFGGKPLGPETAAKFIKVYDRDNTKSIDFNEYVALHQMLEKLSNAFFSADADRSGTLDAREIYTAIQQAGFQGLSPQTIDAFGRKIQALTKPFPQPGQPGGYPPQQPGYPGQPGYPPQQPGQPGQPGYPPQQPGQPGYPPQQGFPPVTIAITFQQFLDICAQLALVKSIFDLADTDRDGRVTFTWDQLAFSTVDLNA